MNVKITDVKLAEFFGLTRQTIASLRQSKNNGRNYRYQAYCDFYRAVFLNGK